MGNLHGADIAFVIFSAALVMLMTPGLALFYGGMVRSKNILSTTMHSYAALAIISIQWILFGYTLAFGPDCAGFIGNLSWAGLKNVGVTANATYAATIPHLLFMVFQMMFAIITAAVISGSFAERMRFPAFLIFLVLWTTFVYDPVAHWVWAGSGNHAGWLKHLGVLDFAGGNVVEINSGVSGLITAIVLGKRNRKGSKGPHHIPMAVLGGGLLWFGWFGFNAGSALAANGVAVTAFVNTNTAAAAGAISWAVMEWINFKKPTVLGTISGAVAGMVGITQGAGFVTPASSILIGFVAGCICFYAVAKLKKKFGYDDALDAFGCHGVAGIWGSIATALFASKAINPNGANGVIYGNWHLLGIHLIGIVSVAAYAAFITFVILKVIGLVAKLRVDNEDELTGLDTSIHGEEAYGEFV